METKGLLERCPGYYIDERKFCTVQYPVKGWDGGQPCQLLTSSVHYWYCTHNLVANSWVFVAGGMKPILSKEQQENDHKSVPGLPWPCQ